MKSILVCTDGSKHSAVCCRYGAWFAKRLNLTIDCLYVSNVEQFELSAMADFGGSFGLQPYHAMIDQVKAMEERKGALISKAVKEIFEKEGVGEDFKYHQHTGHLADCIKEFEETADLILLGKRGENMDLATEHLGSSMERVVRACKKPCLVTSREFREINRVLVSYDGSPSSVKAMDFVSHSELFKDMEVHIVVVDEKAERDDLWQKYLEQGEAVAQKGGLSPVCTLLKGEVESQVSSYVSDNGIDMLVMGAYGHNRIRELIIGSSTTSLIRSCHVPVLLFR